MSMTSIGGWVRSRALVTRSRTSAADPKSKSPVSLAMTHGPWRPRLIDKAWSEVTQLHLPASRWLLPTLREVSARVEQQHLFDLGFRHSCRTQRGQHVVVDVVVSPVGGDGGDHVPLVREIVHET